MYFVIFRAANKQWYWSLRAANHKVIADSAEGYRRRIDAAAGIDLIKATKVVPVFSGKKLVQA